jgi:hypothetical protein
MSSSSCGLPGKGVGSCAGVLEPHVDEKQSGVSGVIVLDTLVWFRSLIPFLHWVTATGSFIVASLSLHDVRTATIPFSYFPSFPLVPAGKDHDRR